MWFSPSVLLFLSSILISIFIILSSPSLLMSWLALELNTLTFIPLMLCSKTSVTSEAAIKYFLTQAMASVIFLIACLTQNLMENSLFSSLLIVSLSIKLGAAPFHAWMPSVAKSLNWVNFFILMTVQKMNPLIIMMNFSSPSLLLVLIISVSLMVGAIQGLNQTSLFLLLTFSSINHMGWMLSASMINMKLTLLYFLLYTILLTPVIMMLNKWNASHINQLNMITMPMMTQMVFFLTLLSLGGLPPFLGFLPKWIILQELIISNEFMISTLMIFMSLLTLYFYLRLTFSAFIFNNLKWSTYSAYFNFSPLAIITIIFSLSGLIFTFITI